VAAVNARSGSLLAWNTRADGDVESLLLRGRTLYLGGSFQHVGGRTRHSLASVDAASGGATTFKTVIANGDVTGLVAGTRSIFAVGLFRPVGLDEPGFGAFDPATGALR
jgi:hypothetical protein